MQSHECRELLSSHTSTYMYTQTHTQTQTDCMHASLLKCEAWQRWEKVKQVWISGMSCGQIQQKRHSLRFTNSCMKILFVLTTIIWFWCTRRFNHYNCTKLTNTVHNGTFFQTQLNQWRCSSLIIIWQSSSNLSTGITKEPQKLMWRRHRRVALHQHASHTVLLLIRKLNQGDRGREVQNKRPTGRWWWNWHVPAVHQGVWYRQRQWKNIIELRDSESRPWNEEKWLS